MGDFLTDNVKASVSVSQMSVGAAAATPGQLVWVHLGQIPVRTDAPRTEPWHVLNALVNVVVVVRVADGGIIYHGLVDVLVHLGGGG